MYTSAFQKWTVQANVDFENLGIQNHHFRVADNRNGEPLIVKDTGGFEKDFIPFGQHGNQYPNQVNVYFVKAFRTISEESASPGDAGGVTIDKGSNVILIKDKTGEYKEDGIVLAHEFGHAFGTGHIGVDPLYLMPNRQIPQGDKLRGAQLDDVRAYLLSKAAYVKKR